MKAAGKEEASTAKESKAYCETASSYERRVWVTRPTTGPQIDSCIIDSHISLDHCDISLRPNLIGTLVKRFGSPSVALFPLFQLFESFFPFKDLLSLNLVYSIC